MIERRNSYWESSRRPLYPKWVWNDYGVGHRHFIIDHDISTVKHKSHTHALGAIPKAASFELARDNETTDDTRRMSAAEDDKANSKKHLGRRGASTPKPSVHFLKRELNRRMAANRTNDENTPEPEICEKTVDAKTTQKNPLADRVINWLDLAGLNTLIRTENQPLEKIPVRRVCTTESLLHRPSLQNGTRFSAPLRRSESVHMLSLTFSDVPYQGPNDNPTFQSFSSAYRASRALLAAHQNLVNKKQTKHAASSSNLADGSDSTKGHLGARSRNQTSGKQSTTVNRKSSSASGVNNDDIEKQYRSLIQRQILEKSCNIQAARRQLHIFMPSLPDKHLLGPSGGLGVEDGDSSYLSTILSSGM